MHRKKPCELNRYDGDKIKTARKLHRGPDLGLSHIAGLPLSGPGVRLSRLVLR